MMDGRRRAWLTVAVWVLVQLTITSVPGSAVPVTVHHPWDWFVHAGMYGMLGLLIAAAAALDEVHQLYIPGRNGSAADWVFDTAGVAAGLLIGRWMMSSAAAKWLR